MKKEDWIRHMEEEGLIRPSLGGNLVAWKEATKRHADEGCAACADRRKTSKANRNRQMRDDVMRSCGLTKVRGAVSGKVYWE